MQMAKVNPIQRKGSILKIISKKNIGKKELSPQSTTNNNKNQSNFKKQNAFKRQSISNIS